MEKGEDELILVKYPEVYELGRELVKAPEFIPTVEGLKGAASVFHWNRRRVASLCEFPALICDVLGAYTHGLIAAVYEIRHPQKFPLVVDPSVDHVELDAKSQKNFKEVFNAGMRGELLFRGTYKGDTTDSAAAASHNLESGWNMVVNEASNKNDLITGIFPQFYSSVFINAWTVFETLSQDLWVSALNEHPKGLAALRGKWPGPMEKQNKKQEKKSERTKLIVDVNPQPPTSEPITSKAIRLEVLQENNYDVSKVMGNLLSPQFSFQRLEEIRDAYFKAFADDHDIWDIMLDPDIRSVCSIRNVLVHRAGYIDADFLDQISGIPRFENANKGYALKIDGKMVREIVSPFFEKCEKLIRIVDERVSRG